MKASKKQNNNSSRAKPFLKWAGGKTQLIKAIEYNLPAYTLKTGFTYIEPFVGSGAVLFWLLNNYPQIEKAIINDINCDLMNTYKIIAANPEELITTLSTLQDEYYSLEHNQAKKSAYYYEKRAIFNSRKNNRTTQAALFIFLNRTCFNGLYRVNSKNEFNVPMGTYKNPTICDSANIIAVSRALQKVEILCGDFQKTLNFAGNNSFFYFDPPYKPLNSTSNFNSYTKSHFNDAEQIRLREFCVKLDKLGYNWMLSNSDVKDVDSNNNFFDELYADFFIKKVKATRRINSNASKRGELDELIITNYSPEYNNRIDSTFHNESL